MMENSLWWVVGIALGGFFGIWLWKILGKRERMENRETLSKLRLSAGDWEVLGEKARIVKAVPPGMREKLEGIVEVLIAETNFEACGGLEEVTREMKLVIMAQAALLLVGREHRYFPLLKSVLIYPDTYTVENEEGDHEARLGESWNSGSIVLSWKSVVKGGEDPGDGRNVVIHEFSHQLDQENEGSVGVPILPEKSDYRDWAEAFGEAYEEFIERIEEGKRTVLDHYGATNPAEFFAVGSETFFEKGKKLRKRYPDLYREMKDYYGLDPAEW
ncbi:MAG: zinc-dependent peptidase [Verrucomicrobiaceae bacterium]